MSETGVKEQSLVVFTQDIITLMVSQYSFHSHNPFSATTAVSTQIEFQLKDEL